MSKLKSVFCFMFKSCLIALLLGSLVGGTLVFNLVTEAVRGLPPWNSQELQAWPTNTIIYDNQGQPAASLRGKINRVPVKLDQIPQVMQDAMLAIEDERFYDHRGMDYWGLGRALYNDLRGGSQEGASTITQQLVKNVLLTPEKSLTRKIREAALARRVEAHFNKREILELYLNLIYFGEGAYGIEAASQIYFGKPCRELTLPEGALLAGLPKNPSRYSPFVSPTDAKNRRNTVLQVMNRNGYITRAELEGAAAAPLPTQRQIRSDEYPYPFFLDQTIEELVRKYGFTQDQIYDGGLQVYTTLDPRIQQTLEQVYADPANFPSGLNNSVPESAMVVLEQKTGGVKGLVGGRTHVSRRGFNRATMLKRQPGSTFKPLVVYAPAIDKGYGPSTLLDSSVEAYGSNYDAYSPENFGSASWGRISMRTAICNSVNTYAVKLLKLIGVNEGYDFGKRLGLNSLNSQDKVLGLALGGTTEGVSPLELAQAYASLANRGVKLEAHLVTKVVDPRGKVLVEARQTPVQVMKPETADMITDLLKSAVDRGTGQLAKLKDRPAAGKTGTTQLPLLPEFKGLKQGNKDAWFAGYTPELVGVVWLGYDITDSTHYLNKISGGSYPATIWHKVFSQVLADAPPSEFAPPPAEMVLAERRLYRPKPPPQKQQVVQAEPSGGEEPAPANVRKTQETDKPQGRAGGSPPAESSTKDRLVNKLFGLFRKN